VPTKAMTWAANNFVKDKLDKGLFVIH